MWPFAYFFAGLLLAPAKGKSLWLKLFTLWAKEYVFTLFLLILGHFWCSVVTSVTFSGNLSNFKNNFKKISKNLPKIYIYIYIYIYTYIPKQPENKFKTKKIQKIKKIQKNENLKKNCFNAFLLVFYLSRLFFDHSSPVNHILESRGGGALSLLYGQRTDEGRTKNRNPRV